MSVAVVTGANGFVGSHLVDLLLEKKEEVHCIVRKTSNLQWLEGKNVTLHTCGLADLEALKPIMQQADFVYHIAGVVSSKTKEGFYKGNVGTTKNVLEACLGAKHLKKVLITSSLAATGPTKRGHPVSETSPLNPVTTYGFSKQEQEKVAHSYDDRLPITIIRPPAVYGPRESEIFLFFKTINSGLFTQVGFDEKSLSLVHGKDLVNGMWLAANSDKSTGETYFIGSHPAEYDWPLVGKISAEAAGKKILTLKVPHTLLYIVGGVSQFFGKFSKKPPTLSIEKASEISQSSWSCSSQKAMDELGYKEQYTIKEGIEETITWYKQQKWLK